MSINNHERLSGTTADGGFTALSTYPTLTEIHSVPAGETHRVFITLSNNSSSGPAEVLGNFGDLADSFNFVMAQEETRQVIDAILVGPTTVDLGAITLAANLKFTGHVSVFKYTS